MTITNQVVETKLDEDFNIGEEGSVRDKAAEDVAADVEGTPVAKGKYIVPKGVAVEELKNFNGHRALRDECPEPVKELLVEKGLLDAYDKLVKALTGDRKIRTPLGKWRDAQVIGVVDLFRDDFAEKNVKIAFCKRQSGQGSFRWLEFIDIDIVGGTYAPQYDLGNYSGQVIKTMYSELKFPNGVAVEELKQWSGRKMLKEGIPVYVERMLEKKDLMEEYEQMIDHVIEAGVGANTKMWNIEKLKELLEVYKPKFAAKGVDIFVCNKTEYVSHGQYGGHNEYFRWIEFVDREEQPSYQPQRNADDTEGEKCAVM
uniref:Uncharacterized protein n=1 Tax=Entomoneis paludosa TaxID=265537 RepID=A0A7S2VDG8_9STRA|mmetsp:Transcript_17818/g.36870  ORF Transcript_17818/g.36870 Transcript_17818/m.36870 type:complete len:314 (+) Transcript_17818:96-1037(+)